MSDTPVGATIRDHRDGTISVEYHPKEAGRHEVLMNFESDTVEGGVRRDLEAEATKEGSPFQFLVDTINGGYITAYGPGLVGGLSGEEVHFTIVTMSGCQNNLVVTVDGASKIDLKRVDNPDGSSSFYFRPMTPGAYNLNIKYKGQHIKGSPFSCKISGVGRKRTQLSLGNSSDYSLKVVEADIVNLIGSIKTPSNAIEPCILKKLNDGQLGIASFTPKNKGQYLVNVYRSEKHITNSPFKINLGDNEIGHASKVKISGATEKATANENNQLIIDTKNSGYGGLSIAIEGPHRSELCCEEIKERVYTINYGPHEPGIYILNIRFADDHVPGSPFLLDVGGNPSGRSRETISREILIAEAVTPNTPCEFLIKIPGTSPFDMEASLTDPEGQTELCEVMDMDDFHYNVRFTPLVEGLHILSIKHKGLHISGSPFAYTVGQLVPGGCHKMQTGGPGLEKGEVGINNDFNIYTREAGPGTFTMAVEGPSPAIINTEERPHGLLGLTYKVSKPGTYGVHLKFNDKHIPGSPFIVTIAPASAEAKQVTVHSLKDRGLQVDKPLTFTVDLNGANGTLHATTHTPSGGHEDCFIQEMDRDVYAVRFIPRENGVHYVDVRLNGAHITDSPFAIMIGSTAADPAMVHALGDGIEHGKTGQKNKFLVRTAAAGSSLLAVTVDGPSKVAISCKEMDDGYEFIYTPFCPGKYLITVKYGNINTAGSPYLAEITGTGRKPSPLTETSTMVVETVEKKAGTSTTKKLHGDASKVIVKGAGLKRAFTNRLQSITLDTKDAGCGMLSVGMVSPNGHPEAELSVRQTSKNLYTLNYKVVEIGDHQLSIKWGDDDVPGSPFILST